LVSDHPENYLACIAGGQHEVFGALRDSFTQWHSYGQGNMLASGIVYSPAGLADIAMGRGTCLPAAALFRSIALRLRSTSSFAKPDPPTGTKTKQKTTAQQRERQHLMKKLHYEKRGAYGTYKNKHNQLKHTDSQ